MLGYPDVGPHFPDSERSEFGLIKVARLQGDGHEQIAGVLACRCVFTLTEPILFSTAAMNSRCTEITVDF